MQVDIPEMLIFFDTLLTDQTNEESGIYYLESSLSDGLTITFSFSIHENYVNISIRNESGTVLTHLLMKDCYEIRMLDQKRKLLEIIHTDSKLGRCFLSPLENSIASYEEE